MIACSNGHENPDGSTYCQVCKTYIASGQVITVDKVAVTLREPTVSVMAGFEARCDVGVANGSQAPQKYAVTVQGTQWMALDRAELMVPAGDEGHVTITFRPPQGLKVLDPLPFIVTVASTSDPEDSAKAEGSVSVVAMKKPPVTLEPVRSHGRDHGTHQVAVRNVSDSTVQVSFSTSAKNDHLAFELSPATLSLDGGEQGAVSLVVRATRPLDDGVVATVHRFQVDVQLGNLGPFTLHGEMEQRAGFKLPIRWMAGMVAFAIAGTAVWQFLSPDATPPGRTSYAEQVMADQPIAYWRFEESSGATSAKDETGNAPGSFEGSPAFGEGALSPDPGRALNLDGVDDWVRLGAPGFSFDEGRDFTVEAFVRLSGKVGFQDAILGPEPEGDFGDSLIFYRERLTLFDFDSTSDKIASASKMPAGEWVHWALVREGNELRIYRDGELDTVATPAPFAFSPEAIGPSNGKDGSAQRLLKGSIDELAIYDTALTPERLRAHVEGRVSV